MIDPADFLLGGDFVVPEMSPMTNVPRVRPGTYKLSLELLSRKFEM